MAHKSPMSVSLDAQLDRFFDDPWSSSFPWVVLEEEIVSA